MPRQRPGVSVVLPFHGTRAEAEAVLAQLGRLDLGPGDELVMVDNSGAEVVPDSGGVRVVRAAAEHSSYYARNEGAAAAERDWLCFVDADCRPRPDLLDRYFAEPVDDEVGAVVGEVEGVAGQDELVARYARSRGHLGQAYHWNFAFRPWGVTANLLVRRAAWESVGGFHEGIRSGGDTEFSWRLQDAGWKLAFRPDAAVEHVHRDSVAKLARQAARYAAGRAWVIRRYPGSIERPKLVGRLARCAAGVIVWTALLRFERAAFKALDAVYVASESTAFVLDNRPPGRAPERRPAGMAVLAGAFPALDRPDEVDAVRAMGPGVAVEARSRPVRVDRAAARDLELTWAEDDGLKTRVEAAAALVRLRPVRTLRFLLRRDRPRLLEVAPRARRVLAAGVKELRAVGDPDTLRAAAAVAELTGCTPPPPPAEAGDRRVRVLRLSPLLDWRALDHADPIDSAESMGGLAAQVVRQAVGTATEGIEQEILTARSGGAPDHATLAPGVTIKTVGRAAGGVHRRNLAWLAGVLGELRRLRRSRDIDVVHVHASGIIEPLLAALAARVLLGRPLLLTLHCSAQVTYVPHSRRDAAVQWLTRRTERAAIRAAARTLVLSRRSAEMLGGGRVAVMHDCLDVAGFAQRAEAGARSFAERLGLPAGAPVALFVGRVSKEKGWPDLLELAVRLRDRGLQIVVCGDGEDLEALRAQAHARGVADAVHCLGAVPAEEVAAAMGAADVLVLPSRHEELGSVLIEAMAAGLPAVAYDAGGTSEVVEAGVTGVIVDRGDLEGLVAATARVLEDGELRERARAEGPDIAARRFDGADIGQRLAEIYRGV